MDLASWIAIFVGASTAIWAAFFVSNRKGRK